MTKLYNGNGTRFKGVYTPKNGLEEQVTRQIRHGCFNGVTKKKGICD